MIVVVSLLHEVYVRTQRSDGLLSDYNLN